MFLQQHNNCIEKNLFICERLLYYQQMHVNGKGNILRLTSAEYVGIRSFGRFARLVYSHISLVSTIAKTAGR